MSNSANLGLPFVLPAQAQKHVTVNEALALLDGAVQLRFVDTGVNTPPVSFADGDCYGIGAAAVNVWFGQDGNVAIASGGGWVFAAPQRGWRAWNIANGGFCVFDGVKWVDDALAVSPFGAGLGAKVAEFDHVLGAGASSTATAAIPAQSVVVGVTGRVVTAVTGTLTSWRLGVSGSDNRYGSGIGLGQGAWLRGLTSSPLAYYSDTDLLLTAEGGDFASGTVRLAVHYLTLALPD